MNIYENDLKEGSTVYIVKLNTHFHPLKNNNKIKPLVIETHNIKSLNRKNQTYIYTQYIHKKEKCGCFYNNGFIKDKGYFFTEAFDDFDEALNYSKKIMNNEEKYQEMMKILIKFFGVKNEDVAKIECSKFPHISISE